VIGKLRLFICEISSELTRLMGGLVRRKKYSISLQFIRPIFVLVKNGKNQKSRKTELKEFWID
jgi:hypothetical protein